MFIDVEYQSNPVSLKVGDLVINRYNQICKIDNIMYYPNDPIEGKPNIDVRLQEGANIYCVDDIHTITRKLEPQTLIAKVRLLERLGEKYE